MTNAEPQELGLLAKLVIAIGIALIVAGIVWYGVTIANIQRIWYQELARPSGPMKFRFILQPLMAAIVAIRDGRTDAQTGRSPFFWTVLNKPRERIARLDEALNGTARIILLGLAMDVIYQFIALNQFYPVEAVIIAVVLAFLPYALIREPVARIARWWSGASPHRIS